ncbi:MAG: hypothetical protein LCH69_13605 [Proteobacteria bacterium]|nr:hypothetical protein [Pseudomonadota bacterium]
MATLSPSRRRSETALSPTSQRLFAHFADAVGKDTRRADQVIRERRAAIAAVIDPWLETLDEPARAAFFNAIEASANACQRKKISAHPHRPEGQRVASDTPEDRAAKPATKLRAG